MGKPQRISYTDNQLAARVRQYLISNRHRSSVNIDEMASDLQNQYRDYRRKKKGAFTIAVRTAYSELAVGNKPGAKSPKGNDNQSDDKNGSTASDSEDYMETEDTNMVNESISGLYRLGVKSDGISSPMRNGAVAHESDKKSKSLKRRSKKEKDKTLPAEKKKREFVVQNSTTTFADIGGSEKVLEDICRLLVHLKHPEVYEQLGVLPPRGFLLHGPPGCGKTLLAHAIAGELELPFIKIAATEIVSGVSGESEEKIRNLFEQAMASAPCILFIDEIDAITPKRDNAQREMERRIVAQLLTCMDDLNRKKDNATSNQVMVIGATNRPDSLDPALRRAGRFDREISLGIPDKAARARILRVLCKDLKLVDNFNFEFIATLTPGYVGADLMSLTRESAMNAVNRVFDDMQSAGGSTGISQDTVLNWLKEQPPLTSQQLEKLQVELPDFKAALKIVQPSAKREGFATVPDVTWDDVGALHSIREELQLSIIAPIRYAEKFEAMGLSTPAGILLCGPPGCGKTLLAKAIANESGLNFISVKGPELLNMYVGESERAVRQCFQRAKNSAPCVIFFDELDALCPRRSESSEGHSSSRVVNQLLTEMDGMESRLNVFILAATNRPDIIDRAVLRPGRLDKVLYVGLPTKQDRFEILTKLTRNGTRPPLAHDVDLMDISADERCSHFTGADLSALVREAATAALKSFISTNVELGGDNRGVLVRRSDFYAAFQKVKPSVSDKDLKVYDKMRMNSTQLV